MTDAIQAYPLQWPAGWRRTGAHLRERSKFGKSVPQYRTKYVNGVASGTERAHDRKESLTIAEATIRVLEQLQRMGVRSEDIVISTNLRLRRDGMPASGQAQPNDPGVAAYWRRGGDARCMGVDMYDRVQDNMAAIAATLEAMRAIERHGGATILDRAFQGFTALPAPEQWWSVLGLKGPNASEAEIKAAHRRLISEHHPDTGGDNDTAARVNRARDQGLEAQ